MMKSLNYLILTALLSSTSPLKDNSLDALVSNPKQTEIFLSEKLIKKQPKFGDLVVQNAKKYLGVEYRWNGRNTKKRPGLGCMGLIFSAYADTLNYSSWKRFSVMPSKLVKSKELGEPVSGLDGILKENLDYSKLKPGDVVYLLIKDYEPIKNLDQPLTKIDNQPYWPWHMVLYEGGPDNLVIHSKPGDKIVEEPLKEIYFDALLVTRLRVRD